MDWSLPLLVAALVAAASGGASLHYLDAAVPTATVAPPGSRAEALFGFSLAQHRFPDGSMTVLVSAPRMDGRVQREGGVFSCPLLDGQSCSPEPAFQTRTNTNSDDFSGVLSEDNSSYAGQMLGFSLRSTESQALACAPLYIQSPMRFPYNNTNYFVPTYHGRCLILPGDLNTSETLQILSEDVLDFRVAGVDTEILSSGVNNYLVVGAAGSGKKTAAAPGQVFAALLTPPSLPLSSVSTDPTTPVLDELLGFHVELGQFSNTVDKQLVASAPRKLSHRGQLELYELGLTSLVPVETMSNISGLEQNGYFGYDFAVLQLGGSQHNYSSIVVGCPLCQREAGSIHIYVHSGVSAQVVEFSVRQHVRSVGPPRGRFGLAVSRLGDLDGDGFEDVAVAAPSASKVYIFRGFPGGLVTDTYQEIDGSTGAMGVRFGFSLSAGLDIDGNGYPDLSVGHRDGVVSYRAVPLMDVILSFKNADTAVDTVKDRACPVNGVDLICFVVEPCFYFTSDIVQQFALDYTLSVDADLQRIGVSEMAADGTISIGGSSLTQRIELASGARTCVSPPHTFIVKAGFNETSSAPVALSIADSATPITLGDTTESTLLGGALSPRLRQYTSGEDRALLSTSYQVSFSLNCSGAVCEPTYNMTVGEDFMFVTSSGTLILSEGNEFGFIVQVHNTAVDSGLNPVLGVDMPQGVTFVREEALSKNALSLCLTRGLTVNCELKNPFPPSTTVRLRLSFSFNNTASLLETPELSFTFSVTDGFSNMVQSTRNLIVAVEPQALYSLTAFTTNSEYRANRLLPVAMTLGEQLEDLGPAVVLRISVANNLSRAEGTTIPLSRLLIYLPVNTSGPGGAGRPGSSLLLLSSVTQPTTSLCYHYNAYQNVSGILSEQPVLPWLGLPPPSSPDCEANGVMCGVVLCDIVTLQPSHNVNSSEPLVAQFTLSTVLNSRAILSQQSFSVIVRVESTAGGSFPVDSVETATSFRVFPAVTESVRGCVPWWIMVVSVVAGISLLVLIIFILACVGVFGRWYKHKQKESAYVNGTRDDTDDSLFVYRHRTIPPIPGVTPDRGGAELTDYRSREGEVRGGSREPVLDAAAEKEREAEEERELELQMQAGTTQPENIAHSASPDQQELEKYTYDPHKGVDESYEGPFETEI